MAEMTAAASAMHFAAQHAERGVVFLSDRIRQRFVEARPAGAAVELGRRRKQRIAAARARECAGAFLVSERAGERAFGALLAQDAVLIGGQQRAPFGVSM